MSRKIDSDVVQPGKPHLHITMQRILDPACFPPAYAPNPSPSPRHRQSLLCDQPTSPCPRSRQQNKTTVGKISSLCPWTPTSAQTATSMPSRVLAARLPRQARPSRKKISLRTTPSMKSSRSSRFHAMISASFRRSRWFDQIPWPKNPARGHCCREVKSSGSWAMALESRGQKKRR